MKKFIYVLAVIVGASTLVGCEKESPESDYSPTNYYYSLKGEKESAVLVEIYKVENLSTEKCAGLFIRPLNKHFDFIIEIESGMPEEMLNASNLDSTQFELDIEFLGIAYNCQRSYKTDPGQGRGYPVEIQKVKVMQYEKKD